MSCNIENLVELAQLVLDGDENKVYKLHVRVRGVTELRRYEGGETLLEKVNKSGTPHPDDSAYAIAYLNIDSPHATYYFNQTDKEPQPHLYPYDYCLEVAAAGGATLKLAIVKEITTQATTDAGGGAPQLGIPLIDGQVLQVEFLNELIQDVVEIRGANSDGFEWETFEDNVLGIKSEK